ncbi:hypothetical protein [Aequorivita viscosa]|uniref:Uncharacterized protein n=1 Tax=Aequorivita viscosa TaxID=797419 RepID=A0A1M6LQ19_9FLAO|nr:hypothetical protein [Aequorivita viscosa]SDX26710.1 hypothetical protein SAMN05216556_12254 [Aequorivita viscosa]SHJ73271.1 hypothetical protein SAMN04487908_1245 [Aequorivita viscosa]
MFTIQLTGILKKLIVKTINENKHQFLANPEPIVASDNRIKFNIHLYVAKDASLLPVPVAQLDGLLPEVKEKLPPYIGISNVKFS